MLKKKTFWLACARAAAPALFFVILLHLAFPNPLAVSAAGATIEVTSVVDVLADDGDCTLREAIQAANLDEAVGGCPAGAGADTIVLPAGVYTLSRAGTYEDANQTGDLDILAGLTIRGAGQDVTTVDGGQIDRVFHILLPGTRVQMEALSITGGAAPEEDELGGGGVLSWGNLTLTAMKFTANSGARGGGARNSEGYLLVTASLFTQNNAFFEGGGLYSDGEMTVHNTLVTANTSPRGAGVSSDNRLHMTDVTLSANIAEDGDGGGLYNDFDAWLDRVTFLDNQALHGAGIYNNQVLWLTNNTFSGNTGLDSETARSYGGALYNDGDIELRNVTLSGNAATIGGGIYNDPDGILTIAASILVDSPIGRNCVNDGEFTSGGYNLEDTAWCPLDHSGDLYNVDPQLMPLDYNGGLTLSFALPPGSPATDVAPGDVCAFADQRNILRPVDSNQDGVSGCDAGAYEGAPGGIIRLEPLSMTVDETEQAVTVSVSRSGGSGPVGVAYDVAGGTAADTVDYALTPGVLSWAQGDESAQTFTVQVLDDLYKESEEYALIGLLDPTGGAGIERPGHMFTLIIQANDPNGIGGGSPVFMPVIRKR